MSCSWSWPVACVNGHYCKCCNAARLAISCSAFYCVLMFSVRCWSTGWPTAVRSCFDLTWPAVRGETFFNYFQDQGLTFPLYLRMKLRFILMILTFLVNVGFFFFLIKCPKSLSKPSYPNHYHMIKKIRLRENIKYFCVKRIKIIFHFLQITWFFRLIDY